MDLDLRAIRTHGSGTNVVRVMYRKHENREDHKLKSPKSRPSLRPSLPLPRQSGLDQGRNPNRESARKQKPQSRGVRMELRTMKSKMTTKRK